MSSFKKVIVVIFSLIFGTLLLLTVSFLMFRKSSSTVSAVASEENWSVDVSSVNRIEMTVELGKVQILPGDEDKLTISCQYPTPDYLDNKVTVTTDQDENTLNLQLSSKRKVYFFGLVRDKACNIIIEIPKKTVPELSVKIQAGELQISKIETKSLAVDGNLAEIEIHDIGVSALEDITVHNNVGSIVAYLSNLPEKTHESFAATLNIGNIDLHLETQQSRGYAAECIYNIGAITVQNKTERGFGGDRIVKIGTKAYANYHIKTDVGEIRIFEDRQLAQ